MHRSITFLLVLVSLASTAAFGQSASGYMSSEDSTAEWHYNAELYQYIVPENPDFLVGVVMADLDMMHFEARYNYEAYKSASLHYGANFHLGGDASFDITPMIGFYFGRSSGVTFGYRLALEYKRFGLYSEGEYALPRLKTEEKYFYNWTELSYDATAWLRAGIVVQRTRMYDSDLELQRGLLAGFMKGDFEGTVYVFNLGWTKPIWVFTAAYSF